MGKENIVILGAGPAGLSAAYHLRQTGHAPVIYDQNNYIGGLCHSFERDGFTFDTFVHFSFSKDPYVTELFRRSAEFGCHAPESQNSWGGHWVRHPVQNNLYYLPTEEKIKIINSFLKRPSISHPKNYDEWLRSQYGDYFTEQFAARYNQKYWCLPPRDMEVAWVGSRMYTPNMEEILRGAFEPHTKNVYYASEMRYPKRGGFQAFLSGMTAGQDVRLQKRAVAIDPKERTVLFDDGEVVAYQHLIASIPLPELCGCLPVPADVRCAADKLAWTSGAIVSVAVRGDEIFPFKKQESPDAPALWFYVYDEDIPFARAYYPGRKSKYNVPAGCSAIQAEVYFHSDRGFSHDLGSLEQKVVVALIEMKVLREQDVLFVDTRYQKYANVVFDHSIRQARQHVQEHLNSQDILCCGRFGEWDYLWSDQSVLSGRRAADILSSGQL